MALTRKIADSFILTIPAQFAAMVFLAVRDEMEFDHMKDSMSES